MLSSGSDKTKLFTENSKNSNLDDSGISLPVFPSRFNLNLHISVTPMMVKKVIMNLDLSNASNALAELFNKCLKESCFPDCYKVSSVVLVFKNVG